MYNETQTLEKTQTNTLVQEQSGRLKQRLTYVFLDLNEFLETKSPQADNSAVKPELDVFSRYLKLCNNGDQQWKEN